VQDKVDGKVVTQHVVQEALKTGAGAALMQFAVWDQEGVGKEKEVGVGKEKEVGVGKEKEVAPSETLVQQDAYDGRPSNVPKEKKKEKKGTKTEKETKKHRQKGNCPKRKTLSK
jgi:hypothetical protein